MNYKDSKINTAHFLQCGTVKLTEVIHAVMRPLNLRNEVSTKLTNDLLFLCHSLVVTPLKSSCVYLFNFDK